MTQYTQEEYETLKAAYASGARRVRYADGTEVEYDRATMRSILADMEVALGVAPRRRSTVLKFTRD